MGAQTQEIQSDLPAGRATHRRRRGLRISTRGEYGLRAMLDLALHYGEGPIALKQIAERQGISEHYLEQLMGSLRKAGLVLSVRGAQGGYQLAAPPQQVSAGAVLRVLEGNIDIRFDEGAPLGRDRSQLPRYGTRHLWQTLSTRVADLLESFSLADLLAAAEAAQAADGEYIYHI